MFDWLSALSDWINSPDHFPTVFVSLFLLWLLLQLILAHFQHRADRRSYKYERSASTGKMRFEKESYHLEKLSSALLQLVLKTEALQQFGESENVDDKLNKEWLDLYNNAVKKLGAAGPFLDYFDPETGVMQCGVKDDLFLLDEDCKRCRGYEGLEYHIYNFETQSLFIRAAILIDSCVDAVQGQISLGVEKVLRIDLPQNDRDLLKSYHHFLHCAYCRIKDCETGTRDARYDRFKDWLRKPVKWMFARYYTKFAPTCPYDGIDNLETNGASNVAKQVERLINEKSQIEKQNARAKRSLLAIVLVLAVVIALVLVATCSFSPIEEDCLQSDKNADTDVAIQEAKSYEITLQETRTYLTVEDAESAF